jgi:hypothetical protein
MLANEARTKTISWVFSIERVEKAAPQERQYTPDSHIKRPTNLQFYELPKFRLKD